MGPAGGTDSVVVTWPGGSENNLLVCEHLQQRCEYRATESFVQTSLGGVGYQLLLLQDFLLDT